MSKWQRFKEKLTLIAAYGFFQFEVGRIDTSNANNIPTNIGERVVNFLTTLAYPLAFIGLVYSAYILLTSQGNPEGWTKVKKNLLYITTGFTLILFAVIFFNFVRSLFSPL